MQRNKAFTPPLLMSHYSWRGYKDAIAILLRKPHSRLGGAGFTLIELLISSAIFLVVMLTVYSSFQAGILGYGNIEEAIDTSQSARQILERINLDLRNSIIYSGSQAKFEGGRNNINFLTLVDKFSGDKIVQDYAFVSYTFKEDKVFRLCKRNQESLNGLSEVQAEEMASNIDELNFSYSYMKADKSLDWKDSWAGLDDSEDEQKTLPIAVKVKLSLKNRIKQDYERAIFLPFGKIE